MTTSTWDYSRRTTAAASILTATAIAVAVAIGVLVLARGMNVPRAWWPHTGQAFATDARIAHPDPCGLIAGPAKAYCEHDTRNRTHTHPNPAAAAWRLVPAGAGAAALVILRRRSAAGQRRH